MSLTLFISWVINSQKILAFDKPMKTSGRLASVELTTIVPGELPDDEGFVPGCGQDHLRVLGIGGDLGNPPGYKRFKHVKHLVTYELYVQWIEKRVEGCSTKIPDFQRFDDPLRFPCLNCIRDVYLSV